ncbi:MAG: VOC family protein [Rikenellaceae bacterium]
MQIKSSFYHANINITDIERSLEFYDKALGLTLANRIDGKDGSYSILYLKDSGSTTFLELTYLAEHTEPYELGENESHLCYCVEGDYDAIREYHRQMGCLCYENFDMGLYFIEDPDGYWIEILPNRMF